MNSKLADKIGCSCPLCSEKCATLPALCKNTSVESEINGEFDGIIGTRGIHLKSIQKTLTAKKLAFSQPVKPVKSEESILNHFIACFLGVVIFFVVFYFLYTIHLTQDSQSAQSYGNLQNLIVYITQKNYMIFFISIVAASVGMLAIFRATSDTDYPERLAQYEEELSVYNQLKDNYRRIRYCAFCDVIFNETGEFKYANESELMVLLKMNYK